jgi:hypothetical protein
MLNHIDSYELTEWMAFERAFGPMGTEWRDYALGAIYQQLQMANGMFGQVNYESNPAADMEPITPPTEWLLMRDAEDEEDAPPNLDAYE